MKKALFLVLVLIFSLNVFAQNPQSQGFDLAQYGVRIEPDRRLIVVLAALEAAGFETPLSAKGAEFRQKMRADLKFDKDLVDKLKTFLTQYKNRHPKATDAQIIAPFVSMAYTLSPAPDFLEPSRTTDLPGEILEVLDFSPLVREFYRRSGLSANLDGYVKDYYQNADADLRVSTKQMVRELLDYLHTKPELTYIERVKVQSKTSKNKNIEKYEPRERERRFFIVPELLSPKGTINFINIGDDYYAVVPPETNLSASEVRNAYLQFVIDPLVLKYAKDISTFRDGIKALLDERRLSNPNVPSDVFLAVSRSLVAAVDARQVEFEKTRLATSEARKKIDLMKTEEKKLEVSAELKQFKQNFADDTAQRLSEAYERGAVLAFYFSDALKGSEEAGFDIAGSLRDIILSLDTTKETNRLAQFAEARRRAEERRKTTYVQPKAIDNPVTVRLLAIDKMVSDKNFKTADDELKKLLEEYPSEAARINYNIGRALSLSAETLAKEDADARKSILLNAKNAYTQAITAATKSTDPALLSLSYVALGRIYEFYEQTEYAVKIYETAIKIGNVEGGAFKEAVEARERLMKKE